MNIALVLAGGTGSRMGADTPKQYLRVDGRMIISYCMETLFSSPHIDAVWFVAERDWHDEIRQEISIRKYDTEKFVGFSLPGANRQLSIYNGLCDIVQIADADSVVLIHDAARPLLSEELIDRCFQALDGHDGVMPVLPMKDTVYLSEDGKAVSRLLQRETLFAGQAPELFVLDKYYEACKALLPDRILQVNGSTEPAVMAGMDIVMVPGDERNFKITTPADYRKFLRNIEENDG